MKGFQSTLLLVVCATGASAQTPAPRHVTITSAAGAITLDGRLDEAAWQQATPIEVRYEFFPGDNVAARVATDCRVTFDPRRLYVGCRADDPDVSALRANLADRDVPVQDDTVGFLIDPFNDGRRAFQFRVNPRGVQMDALNNDVEDADDSEDWTWDAIWDAAARVDATGYTVEIAVPFSSLRFPRSTGVQTWGFAAVRDMPRSTRYRMRSSFVDRNRACVVCQFDKLTGFTALSPGLNLEIDPTLTVARTDARPSGTSALVRGPADTQFGLSARWSIRPNVVLSGTVNPDFYQVEADAAQLDVNNRFQLFFPEKRPFFLEGADLFAMPLDAVFTRNVSDPRGGLKLTGKEGAHAFGAFLAEDSVTGTILPGYEASSFRGVDRPHLASAVRYRRDLGTGGSTAGFLYSGREGGRYSNKAGGTDGLLRVTAADSFRFQWLGSRTTDPADEADGGVRTGQAAFAAYEHSTRDWGWNARVWTLSPDFRADSGFITQVDVRTVTGGIQRTFIGAPGRWFNEVVTAAGCDRTTDWNGRRPGWGCDFWTDYSGPLQMTWSYNAAPNGDYYRGTTYENFRHNVTWSMRPSGAVSFTARGVVGGTVDFANAREAEQQQLFVSAAYTLLGRLEGEVSHAMQRLDVSGRRLFTARLTQSRTLVHLNLRTFARVILQYTDVDRDADHYLSPVAPRTRRLFAQALFSYKINPQTVFLAGYSDNADAARTPDLTRTNRTFFTKVGYAWIR